MRALFSRYLYPVVVVIGLMLLAFTATAHAAAAVTSPDSSWLDLARPVLDAAKAGHYLAAFAFALVFAVAMFKRYAPGKVGEWARGDVGGVLTTFGISFFGAVGTATLATGSGWAGLSLDLAKTAGGVALLAIGGYVGIKKLVIPFLKKIQPKFPSWTAPGFTLIYFLFDKPDAITEAEKAGAAAVAAKPAEGAEAVTGKPETF